jgi:hypothetical protein
MTQARVRSAVDLVWLPHVIADDDYKSTKSSLNGPLVGR